MLPLEYPKNVSTFGPVVWPAMADIYKYIYIYERSALFYRDKYYITDSIDVIARPGRNETLFLAILNFSQVK